MIVVWRVTQECNLACPFCAYDRRMQRPRRNASLDQIERFGHVLGEYGARMNASILVSWIGGEPLMWGPLQTLSERFVREFGLRVSTTTNGTTLGSASMRRHLLNVYAELTVSIDAVGEAHDRLRGWRGGFSSLETRLRQLVHEREEHGSKLKLRVNIVLMRETFGSFRALCLTLADWGVDEITFNQLGGKDRPEFYPGNRLRTEQAEELASMFDPLRCELLDRGVVLSGSRDYLDRICASTRDVRIAVQDCHPGEGFLFIDETGLISPCSFTSEVYGLSIDDFTSVGDLANLPGRFRRQRANHRAAACEDCQSTHIFEKFVAR